MASIQANIVEKLEQAFSPSHLEVLNESASHAVPEGSESHFKVVLVCDQFQGKTAVRRHQAVYSVLAEELKQSVHALALHTYTISEWSERKVAPESPDCANI